MLRSYNLGHRFEAFIAEQLEKGRYGNASEVLRAGLRTLEDNERLMEIRLAELRAAIAAGRDSGVATPAAKVLGRLEARYQAMVGDKDR